MATKFKFEAKDAAGKTVKGSVSANSQSDVINDLRRRNLTPVGVTKSGGLADFWAKANGKKKATRASCK